MLTFSELLHLKNAIDNRIIDLEKIRPCMSADSFEEQFQASKSAALKIENYVLECAKC